MPAGNSLVMMYHLHSYGGVVKIPGSDLAVDVEVRDDNAGPHTIEEIRGIYARSAEAVSQRRGDRSQSRPISPMPSSRTAAACRW